MLFITTVVATAAGSVVGVFGVWLVARGERRRSYSESLDRAVAEVSVAIGLRIDALQDRSDAADAIMSSPSAPSFEALEAEVDQLPEVRPGRLTSAVQVVALTTKKRGDRKVSAALTAAVDLATSRGGRLEGQILQAASVALVKWRSKTQSRSEAVAELKGLAVGH